MIGISTSAGNSVIENTTQNALDILEEIGKSFVTVVRGAEKPLCREIKTASEIHGESGLEGAKLIHSSRCAIIDQPFLYIYKALNKAGKVSFVVTGAMTNLAILLKGFPDIKDCISEVTIMGGAIGLGNMSPAA